MAGGHLCRMKYMFVAIKLGFVPCLNALFKFNNFYEITIVTVVMRSLDVLLLFYFFSEIVSQFWFIFRFKCSTSGLK